MLNVLNVVYGNGYLSDTAFEAGLESLRPASTFLLSDINTNGVNFVGLRGFTAEAEAIGAWVDGDTLYLDPVAVAYDAETASALSNREEQLCYFKASKVVYTETCDTLRLLFALYHTAKIYGGATAIKHPDNYWIVFACEGECVYL